MNAIEGGAVFFRSVATRGAREVPPALGDMVAAATVAGYDLVFVEPPESDRATRRLWTASTSPCTR